MGRSGGAGTAGGKMDASLVCVHESGGKVARRCAENTPKSAAWKIEAARALRQSTTASNAWIAAHFVMGHPSRVCNLIRKKI